MILTAFSKFLQEHNDELIKNRTTTTKLLCEWINYVTFKNPKTNIEKIVHREILFAKNNKGDFFIIGKSDSGRVLLKALNNFAISYENYLISKWLSDKKPKDFNNN